jgi:hypothetical protein
MTVTQVKLGSGKGEFKSTLCSVRMPRQQRNEIDEYRRNHFWALVLRGSKTAKEIDFKNVT